MPHGRRSDRISRRDLEVLEFIARFGLVPRAAVATWAGTSRTVSYERERRLIAAGLLRRSAFGSDQLLLAATATGLRACNRPDLRVAQPSPATILHDTRAARLGARLEREGWRLLSEREILARERAEGRRLLSAELPGGRFHRADLVRLGGEGSAAEAIEVELSVKAAARLDALLRAWRFAVAERRFGSVVYHCAPATRRYVEQAIERTRSAEVISTVELSV